MTICPIAIVAGCKKCPAFKICPLKRVIGDQPSAPDAPASAVAKVPTKAPTKTPAKALAKTSAKAPAKNGARPPRARRNKKKK